MSHDLLSDDDESTVISLVTPILTEGEVQLIVNDAVERIIDNTFAPLPTKPTFLQWVLGK